MQHVVHDVVLRDSFTIRSHRVEIALILLVDYRRLKSLIIIIIKIIITIIIIMSAFLERFSM